MWWRRRKRRATHNRRVLGCAPLGAAFPYPLGATLRGGGGYECVDRYTHGITATLPASGALTSALHQARLGPLTDCAGQWGRLGTCADRSTAPLCARLHAGRHASRFLHRSVHPRRAEGTAWK